MEILYRAKDGKIFSSEEDCSAYEEKLVELLETISDLIEEEGIYKLKYCLQELKTDILYEIDFNERIIISHVMLCPTPLFYHKVYGYSTEILNLFELLKTEEREHLCNILLFQAENEIRRAENCVQCCFTLHTH